MSTCADQRPAGSKRDTICRCDIKRSNIQQRGFFIVQYAAVFGSTSTRATNWKSKAAGGEETSFMNNSASKPGQYTD
jgi:hypothetical protein